MKSILIVDDESDLCEIFETIFNDNYLTYTSLNGAQALEIFNSKNIDFIFTDIDMPIMNGIEFIKKIRASNQVVPICIITGGSKIKSSDLSQVGANFLIEKGDLNFEKLKNAVDLTLGVSDILVKNEIEKTP